MNVRYFYRTEVNGKIERRITVAYTHDRETGATEYGATIFRRPVGDNSQVFEKAPHRNTALGRLQKRPVRVNLTPGKHFDIIEDEIRELVRDRGVRGDR